MSEPDRMGEVMRLFDQASMMPPEQRRAFLDRHCARDERLRREVESLLRAHAEATQFLQTGAAAPTVAPGEARLVPAPPAQAEEPGMTIGRYRLLERLGEGGFGAVWMAEQREPVRRRVALKIIKLGMDTRQVIARFEAERQALALMDHPNIARVFDAGSTETGRPFFVMELVRGVPITEHCDVNRLGVRQRLELFIRVCQAVHHAHQKGVIHRDIKPSNVLVTLHDGAPVPKVIDFGIAKATSAELTERTLFTEHRQVIGTPAYMSPEQAEMSGLDVDTRTDVYSLGVLLYEMLTGTTPLDARQMLEAGYAEMLRMIRESEPQRPSTRVSTARTGRGAAAAPQADPRRLGALFRGDIDWIVMKALEKDRTRRYDSAAGMAQDIQRHLDHEPVLASPPSAAYRLGKLMRRHRAAFAAGSVVAIAVTAGAVGATWGLINARIANDKLELAAESARADRDRADAQARRAVEAERQAHLRARELEEVSRFQSMQLAAIDARAMGRTLREAIAEQAARGATTAPGAAPAAAPRVDLGRVNFTDVAVRALQRDVFEAALTAARAQFADQPRVRASLLQATAMAMREMGLLEQAESPQLEAIALLRADAGETDPDFLATLMSLAHLRLRQARHAEAADLYRQVAEGRTRRLGQGDRMSIQALSGLGEALLHLGDKDQSEQVLRDALRRAEADLAADDAAAISVVSALAVTLQAQGRLPEADPYYRRALEARRRALGSLHPYTLSAVNNMAWLLQAQGKIAEAEPFVREALAGYREVSGNQHPDTLTALNNLGVVLKSQGRFAEAEPLQREALETSRRLNGVDHPGTLVSLINLGALLKSMGRYVEAEQCFRDALEAERRVQGPDHPHTLIAMAQLGHTLQLAGRYDEAEPLAREALEGRRRAHGLTHTESLASLNDLTAIVAALGRVDEAAALHAEGRRLRLDAFGAEHPETQSATVALAVHRLRHGGADGAAEAEALLREVLEIRRRELPDGHPQAWLRHHVAGLLGEALLARAEAEADDAALLREAEALIAPSSEALIGSTPPPPPSQTGGSDRRLEAVLRAVRLFEALERREGGARERDLARWRAEADRRAATRPTDGAGAEGRP